MGLPRRETGWTYAPDVCPPFPCKVAAGVFQKMGGSQRSGGALIVDGERIVYLGVGFAEGDIRPAYDALPDITDPARIPQILPRIAIVEHTGSDTARMLFQPHSSKAISA